MSFMLLTCQLTASSVGGSGFNPW